MGPLFYMLFYKSGLYDIFSLNKFFKKKGGKGMAINYEQFNEMRDSLTASDFRSVLSYYGLTIERNGFLCPFHQSEHHQNCRIRSNGKSAYCYVCNRPINAVDITQYFEGGTPLEAMEFLWGQILGQQLPEKGERKPPILNFKFLHMIGLCHPTGINTGIVNEIHYLDPMPEGREREPSKRDFDGYCPVYGKKESISFSRLYEQEPETALWILYNKTQETIDLLYKEKKLLWKRKAYFGNDLKYIRYMSAETDKKIVYLKKMRSYIVSMRKKAS